MQKASKRQTKRQKVKGTQRWAPMAEVGMRETRTETLEDGGGRKGERERKRERGVARKKT